MRCATHLLTATLLAMVPLAAQAPQGWMARLDKSPSAVKAEEATTAKLVTAGTGLRATNAQGSAVFYNPSQTAAGKFTAKATFKQMKKGQWNEYYGLTYGGQGLEGANQAYTYFMVAQDGTYLIKRRTGDQVTNVTPKTPHEAVTKVGADGTCTNTLEVKVLADKVDFVVNGKVVHTATKAATDKTDGVVGLRVNHGLDVQIDGFKVTKN